MKMGSEELKLLVHENLEKNEAYITRDVVDRQFEVQVREDLVRAYGELQATVAKKKQKIQFTALSLPKEFRELRLCDIFKDLGSPTSTDELLQKLEVRAKVISVGLPKPISENNLLPSSKKELVAAFAGYTPKKFTHETALGGHLSHPVTLHKQPRAARPGESVFTFSATTGSPVLIDSCASSSASSIISENSARVKLEAGNGQVIDVDLVFRGAPIEIRNQIVTDFRCWARSRSAMQTRKILPHRAIGKKNASLSKKHRL